MVDQRMTKDAAKRQMAAADKRIKGISSIASNTVKRAKMLEIEKQYGTSVGNKQAVTSVDKALKSLSKSTDALAHGVKLITVETARGVKSITTTGAKAMNEYAKAIGEDIHINRQNFMVTTIGKFTPLVGYAVAKMMETAVFRNMIDKMKAGLNRALNAVTSRFKSLAMAGWDKGKDLWESFRDKISGKRGAVNARMAKARAAKKEKRYHTQDSAIKAALSDAKVAAAIRNSHRNTEIESQVPHMATGGYVKKEGIAKVHAAEVVQPIDSLIKTIVESVTTTIEKREKKKKPEEEFGSQSFFQKAKKKDLFGFEKVSDTITRTFDIMTRRNMSLETRVMKRDKANQKGLIGSFIEAYSHEAKQEELPLMERQVRATLELKNTISGENKTLRTAITKVLYEHPMFHAFVLMNKGLGKLTTMPFKFLFRKRGRATYANELSKKGTVFEQMANTSALTYSTQMQKLDDIIANTYVMAQSSAGTLAATEGGKLATNTGARAAPTQKKTWSFAGQIYKGLVKKPADFLANLRKTVDPDSKTTALLTGDMRPGAVWRAAKKVAKDQILGTEEEQAQKKKATETANANLLKLIAAEKKKKAAPRKAADENLRTLYRDEARRKESLAQVKKQEEYLKKQYDSFNNILNPAGTPTDISRVGKKVPGSKFPYEKEKGSKTKTGEQTTHSVLTQIASNTKENVKVNRANARANTGWFSKIKGAALWIGTGVMGMLNYLKDLPEKLFGKLGKILGKIPGIGGGLATGANALGKGITSLLSSPAGKVVATAAAGYAVGTLINKAVVAPALEKKYKEVDKIINKGNVSSSNVQKSGYQAAKDYREGKIGSSKESAQQGVLKARQMARIQSANSSESVKSSYGLLSLSGVNFQRVTNAQTEYMDKHIGEYIKYDPNQIDELREKWTKGNYFRSKNTLRGETWEIYGQKREEAFLKYLKSKGKELSSSKIDKAYSKYTTPRSAVIKAKSTPAAPAVKPTGLNKETKDNISKYQKIAGEWLPIANTFLGNTSSGAILANYLRGASEEHPNAIANQASDIVKLGREGWLKYGGDEKSYKIAETITKQKNDFLNAYQNQSAFEDKQMDKASGKFTERDTLKYAALDKSRNAAGVVSESAKSIYSKGRSAFNEATKISAEEEMLRRKSGVSRNRLSEASQTAVAAVKETSNSFKDTIKSIWDNPISFFGKLQTKASDGITAVDEKLKESNVDLKGMHKIAKDEANYQAVVRGVKGAKYKGYDGGSLSYQESQIKTSPTKQEIAAAEAKRDVGIAEMTSKALDKGMTGMKEVVEKGTKNTTAIINNVMNQSSKIISSSMNNGNSGDTVSPQRPIDGFTQKVLMGEIG